MSSNQLKALRSQTEVSWEEGIQPQDFGIAPAQVSSLMGCLTDFRLTNPENLVS